MAWNAVESHPLLTTGLLLVSVVHLAAVGLLAGTASVAVAIDGLGGSGLRRLAKQLAGLAGSMLLAVAGIEVTATLILVGVRAVHPYYAQPAAFWGGILVPLVAGLALLALFRRLLEGERPSAARTVVGLAGVASLLASSLLLCAGAGVLLQPEQWPTAEPPWRFLPTWAGTGRFLELTCLSLAATGAAILSLAARAPPEEAAFARKLGARMTLLFLLAWPPALLFTHLNLPAIALSPGGWAVAAAGLGLAGAAAWLAAGAAGGTRPPRARALLAASFALFGVLVTSDHLARANALEDATLAGVIAAPAPAAVEVAAAPAGKVAAGKAVFDRVCSLCHRFETKLVGPPFNAVIPKYRSDPRALKAFIRSPVKKDPRFPAMPKPAVNEAEIDAVATYLLEQAKP